MTDRSVCREIVERVAQNEGTDQAELTPPLGAVIDTDALESFVASSNGTVQFEYCGYEVTIYDADDVLVYEKATVTGQLGPSGLGPDDHEDASFR